MQSFSLSIHIWNCIDSRFVIYTLDAGKQRIHYENKPIQIYWKFYHQNMKIFR